MSVSKKELPIMLLVKFEVKESELDFKSDKNKVMYYDREQSLKGTDHFSSGEVISHLLYCNCRHLICVILPRRYISVTIFFFKHQRMHLSSIEIFIYYHRNNS